MRFRSCYPCCKPRGKPPRFQRPGHERRKNQTRPCRSNQSRFRQWHRASWRAPSLGGNSRMHSAKTFRACGPCVPASMRSSITAFLSMGTYMGAIFVPCLPLGHAKPWTVLSHAPTCAGDCTHLQYICVAVVPRRGCNVYKTSGAGSSDADVRTRVAQGAMIRCLR